MEIWLVRHGETTWSKSGQHTSITDLALTADGEAQARRVGEKLSGVSFDAVWSSPRQRALRTAALAGFAQPTTTEALAEWNYGNGEGLTSTQIREHIPDWRIWTHGAPRFGEHPELGESKPAIAARLYQFLCEVKATQAQRVLFFGHGHCLRALATVWCEFPIEAGGHFPLATAGLSVLGYEKTTPALMQWNA
ncbi:MAG: histidine phosphatase family protein [Propionibacteriaceae bacterium]